MITPRVRSSPLADGFGGGDRITDNLVLNFVRESKDHGPFNRCALGRSLTSGRGTFR